MSDVPFIQSGHGPVRTVRDAQSKILAFSDFGVKYNGSQDDYEAILACLNIAREQRLFIVLPLEHPQGQLRYLRVFPDSPNGDGGQ